MLPQVFVIAAPGRYARLVAALLYVGAGSVITGPAAVRLHQVARAPVTDVTHVLTGRATTARSRAYVRVLTTRRPEPYVVVRDGVRLASVERAIADTARATTDVRAVLALIADAVQRNLCGVDQLADELRCGPRRGSAVLRAVLDEVGAGARSAPEAELLQAVIAAGLPRPRCNVPLRDDAGRVLAVPDLCWPDVRLVVEIDSREWHLSPSDWEYTMRRHNRLVGLGFSVLHFPPSRLRQDLVTVVREIAHAYERLAYQATS